MSVPRPGDLVRCRFNREGAASKAIRKSGNLPGRTIRTSEGEAPKPYVYPATGFRTPFLTREAGFFYVKDHIYHRRCPKRQKSPGRKACRRLWRAPLLHRHRRGAGWRNGGTHCHPPAETRDCLADRRGTAPVSGTPSGRRTAATGRYWWIVSPSGLPTSCFITMRSNRCSLR